MEPRVLVTETATLDRNVTAETPPGMPDVRLVVVPAILQVLVRGLRTYLQSFLGFLGATAIGAVPTDPVDPPALWQKIVLAAGLALAPTLVSVVQNLIELTARLDAQHPELRG